jgi:hypothetical protein
MKIHCHRCGGCIATVGGTAYVLPSEATPPAVPHAGLCTCERALIYGAPPGYMSSPGFPVRSLDFIGSPSRN